MKIVRDISEWKRYHIKSSDKPTVSVLFSFSDGLGAYEKAWCLEPAPPAHLIHAINFTIPANELLRDNFECFSFLFTAQPLSCSLSMTACGEDYLPYVYLTVQNSFLLHSLSDNLLP
ncbi:hypothetical protein H4Q26_013539 [Puccinia striiformis f. sp. tritici PST-130]|nr:hypothetical protein H4Q26_013539 [Puccinia striiformis f. sp. tritici PST-130]